MSSAVYNKCGAFPAFSCHLSLVNVSKPFCAMNHFESEYNVSTTSTKWCRWRRCRRQRGTHYSLTNTFHAVGFRSKVSFRKIWEKPSLNKSQLLKDEGQSITYVDLWKLELCLIKSFWNNPENSPPPHATLCHTSAH